MLSYFYYLKSNLKLLKELCCIQNIKSMERRSICSAAAAQHKLDEAPETFKQGLHEIKSRQGLHTDCMLGQRNISGVPDL